MITVDPDSKHNTHHISLSDGSKTIGLKAIDSAGNADPKGITRAPVPRTALKTSTGNPKYSDFELPWTPIAQDDWTGGRAQAEFEKDVSRFFDNYRTNTMGPKVLLGGLEKYTTGYRNQDFSLPGSVSWSALIAGSRKYLAKSFSPSSSYDAATITMLIRRVGTPTAVLTIELCSNNAGDPGSVLQTATVTTTVIDDVVSVLHDFTITSQTIVSGTTYWVKIYSSAGTDADHWEVGISTTAGTTEESSDNSAWSTSTIDLYYRIRDTDDSIKRHLFQYKNAMYFVENPDTVIPGRLYINGDRGAADSNTGALTTLIDATKVWTNDEWIGFVVQITAGTGSTESINWRTVTDNDATTLTVDMAWKIEHDTTTEYVVLGSNKWTEITGYDTYTKSLLHGDGVDGATLIVDETGKTWTAYGNAQIDTAQSKFGGGSILFDGNDYISTPHHVDFNFGSGDFTIDAWIRHSALPGAGEYQQIASHYSAVNGWFFASYNSAGTYYLVFRGYTASSIVIAESDVWTPSVNTWYHVEVGRNGSSWYFFVDGVQIGSTGTDSDAIGDYTGVLYTGGAAAVDGFKGWIEERRISKGVCRHTAGFSVETTAYGAGVVASKPITDVCVVNDIAYLCQGDGTAIVRFRGWNNSGTWTNSFSEDGTNKATFLKVVHAGDAVVTYEGSVTAASNATPIEITSNVSHGLTTGDAVVVASVGGNTAANGYWFIRVTADAKFVLIGSVGNGAYTSGGTWSKPTGQEIWRANNKDANGYVSVSKSKVQAWGTNLVFLQPITFQDDFGRINGLEEYGDESRYLFVLREGMVYSIVGARADAMPLPEMATFKQYTNGRAHTVHNVYLWFNLGGGAERYYNRNLDDVGPNRDEGLPTDRQGNISCFVGYPGRLLAAMDAGASGYSSILAYNNVGWTEIYRTPMIDKRIRHMAFQVVPGASPDRLWISQGDSVLWLPFPTGTLNPEQDSSYPYTWESTLTSSWMHAGMTDIVKLFSSLKLFTEDLEEDEQEIEAEYQLDDDTAWYRLPDTFIESPSDEVDLRSTLGLNGKRLRVRVRLFTTDSTKTPKLKGTVLECASRISVKYSYALAYRMEDGDVDLLGMPEGLYAEDVQAVIDEWSQEMTPLTMRCVRKLFDNKKVFIDPTPATPIRDVTEGYLHKLTVMQYERI